MTETIALEGWRAPPTFDADYYRSRHPDLRGFSDKAAREHYEQHGRGEGRAASPFALREAIADFLAQASFPVLEIGPFYSPLVRGSQVSYLDVLSAEELRARAVEVGGDPDRCPERIDYVGDIEQVDRPYDAVVSCHAIEHQPDLVRHLREVARVLTPGGAYLVVIPDKRYCFDHFMAESSISEVLAAAHERRKAHTVKSVIDHWARATHNDPGTHWLGMHGTFPPEDYHYRLWAGLMAYEEGKSNYIDVHAWYFTPFSFSAICQSLRALNLLPLELEAVYDTTHNRAEFCAVLRKPPLES